MSLNEIFKTAPDVMNSSDVIGRQRCMAATGGVRAKGLKPNYLFQRRVKKLNKFAQERASQFWLATQLPSLFGVVSTSLRPKAQSFNTSPGQKLTLVIPIQPLVT